MAGREQWLVRQCERCREPVNDRELAITRRQIGANRRLHAGCLRPLEQRGLLLSLGGVRCIFCRAGGLTLRELIDHFGREHGPVLVNW